MNDQTPPATPRLCLFCGKPITNQRAKKFCCHKCASDFNNRKHAKILNTTQTCPICGTVFELGPKKHRQLYCSIKCRRIANGMDHPKNPMMSATNSDRQYYYHWKANRKPRTDSPARQWHGVDEDGQPVIFREYK